MRHGKPENEPNHWIRPNTPLSNEGIDQAETIAMKLSDTQFDLILTSPLLRAKQTAEIIKNFSNETKILREEKWLSEINLGDWAGSNKHPELGDEVIKGGYNKRGPLFTRILLKNIDFTFPSGENLHLFWNRVRNGLQDSLNQFKGSTDRRIAVIGHGGSLTVILFSLLGFKYGDKNFPLFIFGLGDVTIIRMVNNQIHFLAMNLNYSSNNYKAESNPN
ncbi:MAG: histidine phosphatase family protein [Candidatus Hodarchaeales archaeon]